MTFEPLPERPGPLSNRAVAGWAADIELPTYRPDLPDRYPAYLDHRVYQGSSGRVYPLPFHDRIASVPAPQSWTAVHLENAWVRVMVLPELGGRIHLALDRRTGYEIFYANPVIKPALVGLAGPWIAGGVEFNWPQHHRPATYLPTAWELEEEADGSVTVWCSDHDPFARMKGMHGVRLRPDSTVIELRARLYNRSDEPQTFLWWANVAAAVHDDYQSFFPDDVEVVADHAKRAVTTFPAATGSYYGVDYQARRDQDSRTGSPHTVPGDRLDWYRNIPVPTSYMCVGSREDFFGGYDHRAEAGFVHWADHHYAVGKKQWSWGDSPFGHAWNANLADDGTAYIELMAGVYTDNQPDFSHLTPGETKVFSQHWYPVAGTGLVVAATLDLALGVRHDEDATTLVLDCTRALPGVTIRIAVDDAEPIELGADLDPGRRWHHGIDGRLAGRPAVTVEVSRDGSTLLRWPRPGAEPAPPVQQAREPQPPSDIAGVEELYLTGVHLEQYRHPTRSPEPYWLEALRRDPGHAGSHTALALRCYRRARYGEAADHLRAAVRRLTVLNPNPAEGLPHYLLGLTLLRLGETDDAYAAFAKATWLHDFVAPGSYQMALLDASAGRTDTALVRTAAVLRAEPEHLQARALRASLLRRTGQRDAAAALLDATLALDGLDALTRFLAPDAAAPAAHRLEEAQTLLDVGIDLRRGGAREAALDAIERAAAADLDRPLGQTAVGPLAGYHAALVAAALGDTEAAAAARKQARNTDRTWVFPSRLDDVAALEAALAADPDDPTAAALLGHWLYAHDRPADALASWRRSLAADPSDPVVWRNVGLAAYNHEGGAEAAVAAYDRARALALADAKLLGERDQLAARLGEAVADRLGRLEQAAGLVAERDDLTVAYANLLIAAGRAADAADVLRGRAFQPWEGGEGQVLRTWERAQLAIGSLAALEAAVEPPASLGETRHPLANASQLLLALGDACAAAGESARAERAWREAAESVGDFAEMTPQAYSENTMFSVLAARRLGDDDLAETLVGGLREYLTELRAAPVVVDFFATSLPTMLLFTDDLAARRDRQLLLIHAQLAFLDGDTGQAQADLDRVLADDPTNDLALDLAGRVA